MLLGSHSGTLTRLLDQARELAHPSAGNGGVVVVFFWHREHMTIVRELFF
jgi:hypothetical protein